MIRIAFPSSLLSPSINIDDATDTSVASGTMALDTTEVNGYSWYTFSFTGTPGGEYHIQVDGGATLTTEQIISEGLAESQVRYIDEWVSEDIDIPSASTIASAVRTNLATELARLDATISSRMATFSYTAPDNASITAIKAKTDQLLFTATNLHTVAKVVEDKTGYALTVGERTAIATAVEQAILNEGDGQAILNAIVGAIGNTNVSEVALVAAIRADLERVGGAIKAIPTNPLLTDDTRLDHLDADISSRAVPGDVSIQLTSSANAPSPISLILQ